MIHGISFAIIFAWMYYYGRFNRHGYLKLEEAWKLTKQDAT